MYFLEGWKHLETTEQGEHMEIPEQHYKVVARIPSTEFQKICRDLKEFGETIQITGSKDAVRGDVWKIPIPMCRLNRLFFGVLLVYYIIPIHIQSFPCFGNFA